MRQIFLFIILWLLPSIAFAQAALTDLAGQGFGKNGQHVQTNKPNSFTQPQTITSGSSAALVVGPNGQSNPVLTVISGASDNSGISIAGGASGSPVTLTETGSGSGTSSGININTKTLGYVSLASGVAKFSNAGSQTPILLSPNALSGQSTGGLIYQEGADTGITAGTESNEIKISGVTRTWATGALATQRDFLINGSTYAFAGASTVTNGSALGIRLPGCGTNATCTNMSGLYHATTALTGTPTNSYIINVAADTGATNNYALATTGNVQMNSLASASGAETDYLCLDGSGNLYSDSAACLSSSGRFKDVTGEYRNGLATVMALEPERYTYKADFRGGFNDINHTHEQVGLVAENVAKVEPDLIIWEKDGVTPRAVRYDHVTAVLISAVQEQQKEIYALFAGLIVSFLLIGYLGYNQKKYS